MLSSTRQAIRGRADERGLLHVHGENVVAMKVSRTAAPRALAVLATLFAQAREAGFAVRAVPTRSPSSFSGPRASTEGVEISWLGIGYEIVVEEETGRTPHQPTATERAQQVRHTWARIPEWDYQPTGRLRLVLPVDAPRGGTPARARFADGKRSGLEDKIGPVLHEIRARAEARDARRREHEQLDALYQQARNEAIAQARLHYLDDLRADSARAQARQWAEAERLRGFATAMRHRPADTEGAAWADWILAYANRLDPIDHVPAAPNLPEHLTENDLHDYLQGWPRQRPYGWRG